MILSVHRDYFLKPHRPTDVYNGEVFRLQSVK